MKLYWLDIETTGLFPNKNQILEMAVSEATLEDPFTVKPIYHEVFAFGPGFDGIQMDPHALEMHTKNGLLEECKMSHLSAKNTPPELHELIPDVADYSDRPVLAGSSVHFDHGFLKVWMPRLANKFSHRYYDVSAIMLFCRSLGMPKPEKKEAHRAEADVLESVELAKHCRDWLKERYNTFHLTMPSEQWQVTKP